MTPVPRIVSLVPSLTECICALGLAPRLVGRTGFCIHPADAVAGVPKVGGTKDVALDKVVALAPTHLLVNIDENRREDVAALRERLPQCAIVVTHPNAPADNLALFDLLARTFAQVPGVQAHARHLSEALETALMQTADAHRARPERVLYLIWRDPWMGVAQDTYIARMLAHVGWQSWPAQDGGPHGAARYPVIHGHEPWLATIDRVLLSSEPYRFTAQHLPAAQALCPQAHVQLIDGERVSWYGPRAASGLRLLAGMGHP